MSDPKFEVVAIEDLVIEGKALPEHEALFSPYVWREHGELLMLIRAWPMGDSITGRIWLGRSEDGLRFTLDAEPLIAPSLELDAGGCEDPTVFHHEGQVYVFYTGLDAQGRGELLYASGPDILSLEKHGVAFACSMTELNTKEATISVLGDRWRLFHEYARKDRSRIGLAVGPTEVGPWEQQDDPIVARSGKWDDYHLSTGPMIDDGRDELLMFYNGSDAVPRWSIGWATFDRQTLALRDRCDDALLGPMPGDVEDLQITFAASLVRREDGLLSLYMSCDDMVPRRATLRRL